MIEDANLNRKDCANVFSDFDKDDSGKLNHKEFKKAMKELNIHTSRDDIVVADLTPEQHETNNKWFKSMLSMLKDDGELYVPCLNKSFNKLGEEINNENW